MEFAQKFRKQLVEAYNNHKLNHPSLEFKDKTPKEIVITFVNNKKQRFDFSITCIDNNRNWFFIVFHRFDGKWSNPHGGTIRYALVYLNL